MDKQQQINKIDKKIKESRRNNLIDGWEERLDLFFDKMEIKGCRDEFASRSNR